MPAKPPAGRGAGSRPPPGGRPPPTHHERRKLAEPPRPSAGLFGPAPIAPVRALGLLATLVGAAGLALAVASSLPPRRAPALPLACTRTVEQRFYVAAPAPTRPPGAATTPAGGSPLPVHGATGPAGGRTVAGLRAVSEGSRLVCAEQVPVPPDVALEAGDAWVQGADGAWRHHPGGMAAPLRLLLDLPLPLNRVTLDELLLLPGLNGRQARAIVAHRARLGPFAAVDDLLRVHGIGKKTLARVRARLTVAPDAADPTTPEEPPPGAADGRAKREHVPVPVAPPDPRDAESSAHGARGPPPGGDDVADGGTAADADALRAAGRSGAPEPAAAPGPNRRGAGDTTVGNGETNTQGPAGPFEGAAAVEAPCAAGRPGPGQATEVPPSPEPPGVHPLDAPLPDSPLAPPPAYGRGLDARRAWLVDAVRFLPQATLSRGWGWLARRERPRPLVRAYQRAFVRAVGIDMAESEHPLEHYPSLQALFCRRLRAGARPLDAASEAMLSPVDGRVGQCGRVTRGTLLQVKGRSYSLARLLDDEARAASFEGGAYATLYLAPRDYHRIHAPLAGTVHEARLIRGSLLPVFEESLHKIDELFARNERIVTYLRGRDAAGGDAGELAVVKVAATLVGCVRTSYDAALRGNVAGAASRAVRYAPPIALERGAELGTFELGSTVVLVAQRGQIDFAPLAFGQRVRVGERIGSVAAGRGAYMETEG